MWFRQNLDVTTPFGEHDPPSPPTDERQGVRRYTAVALALLLVRNGVKIALCFYSKALSAEQQWPPWCEFARMQKLEIAKCVTGGSRLIQIWTI